MEILYWPEYCSIAASLYIIYGNIFLCPKKKNFSKMFYILIGDKWCSAVPHSWIIDKKMKLCAWPPRGTDVTKAIKKSLPPQSFWERDVKYNYLIGPFKSLDEARKKEKEAANVSSDESKIKALQNETNICLKRKRTPKVYEDFTENVETDSTEMDSNGSISDVRVLCPPSNYKAQSHIKIKNEKEKLSSSFCSPVASRSSGFNESQPLDYGNYMSQNKSFEDEIQSDILNAIQDNQPKVDEEPSTNTKSITNVISSNIEKKQSAPELKYKTTELKKCTYAADISNKNNKICEKENKEGFKKFCNELNTEEDLRKQFQKKIRGMGGKSAENHVINCCVMTITNELGRRLTWEGQRNTEGIKNTPFATIILGTILNMYSSASLYNLKKTFSEWLRRAGDRYRYEMKKLK